MKTTTIPCEVKCAECGKTIPVDIRIGIAVDYVWRDGRCLCHECNKREKRK